MSGKIVVFRSEGRRYIDMIINVKNYDDGFNKAASAAIDEWYESTDEFTEFVTAALKDAGYQLELIEYESFDDE